MAQPYKKNRGGGGGGGGGRGWGGRGGRGGGGGGGGGRGGGGQNYQNDRRDAPGGGRGGGGGGGGRNRNKPQHNGGRGGGGGGGGGGNAPNPSAAVMVTLLRLLFEKNAVAFNPETGALDLSNMRNAEDLKSAAKSVDFNAVSFCKALSEVLSERFGNNIRILVFNDNQITRAGVLFTALYDAGIHQNVTAISATGNDINDYALVAPLKRYPSLNELVLSGNKIAERGDYRSHLSRGLPSLAMLDFAPVERHLLSLPNPVTPAPGAEQRAVADQLAQFVESNLIFPMQQPDAVQAIEQQVSQVYRRDCAVSISRAADPIPRNIPFSQSHRNGELDRGLRTAMITEMSAVRQGVRWRNVSADVQSLSAIARDSAMGAKYLKSYAAAASSSVTVQVVLNPCYNVVMLQGPVKVPVALVTLHGRLNYLWSPRPNRDAPGMFPPGQEPFLSTFFDRTVTVVWENDRYMVANDMIFARPDKIIIHESGASTEALFFATNDDYVDKLRRRLLPNASHEVMKFLSSSVTSDKQLQETAAICGANLPPEQLQSVEAVQAFLNSGN